MGVRYFLPSVAGSPPISPAYHTSWHHTGDASRVAATKTRDGSAFSQVTISSTDVGVLGYPIYSLLRQFITPALTSQDVTDIAANGASSSASQFGEIRRIGTITLSGSRTRVIPRPLLATRVLVRVFDSGGSDKGLAAIMAGTIPDTGNPYYDGVPPRQSNAGIIRGTFATTTSYGISAVAGDYLVFEFGLRFDYYSESGWTPTSYSATFEFGAASPQYLPYGLPSTDDGQRTPWIIKGNGVGLAEGENSGVTVSYTRPRRPTRRPSRIAAPVSVTTQAAKFNVALGNRGILNGG